MTLFFQVHTINRFPCPRFIILSPAIWQDVLYLMVRESEDQNGGNGNRIELYKSH